ncbi:polysaccharide biosynthesis/export family protein [Prevotella sp. P6B4]|uniref:polysaccharide biosynthesis/export family protein n=1 Tax=Prevotella sp. P6B4 TaxID=1410614 RepID=UPI00048B404D|nr:polysaccharide biosynthesis/export family protein [Prevotella sp. P6B4]
MNTKSFIAICATVVLASCSTPQNFNYLQDLENGQQTAITVDGHIRLQPNDQITVIVKSKDPQLSNLFNKSLATQISQGTTAGSQYIAPYTVSPQGTIEIPVVGEIQISGMTRYEAEQAIKRELQKELLKDANVTVELHNMTYTVTGEVKAPGVYKIEKDQLTLMEALGKAGDLSQYGKRDSVMVVRTEGNMQKTYILSLNSAKDLFGSEAYYIHQNDIIYVKANDVRARQSTANGNETRSISFWLSIVSVLTTVAVLVFK